MQIPSRGKPTELRHQDPEEVIEATIKITNKIKISLDSLERLGVSPSAQEIIRRGTGQVIPSFAGGAAIQRLPGTLGLVRGHLVRGTSVGCGLLLRNHQIRNQRR